MPRAQAAKQARNHPVRSRRGDVNSDDHKIGQDRPRAMKSTGPAKDSLEPALIEPVTGPVSKQKLDNLMFMEDMVEVMVHDSTNPQDEPMPCVWNGGVPQRFQRGKAQTVKRKFVEQLARQKKTTYTQEKTKDANGDDTYVQIPHTALLYPFSVLSDPSPNGRAWLQKVLAEA